MLAREAADPVPQKSEVSVVLPPLAATVSESRSEVKKADTPQAISAAESAVSTSQGHSERENLSGVATCAALSSLAALRSSAASTSQATPTTGISLSGRSIRSILQSEPPADTQDIPEEEESEEPSGEIDPDVEEALSEGCIRYAKELMRERPRMGFVFEEAEVSGNCVSLSVPNESTYDELMHNLSEMKVQLAEISHLQTAIEFKVSIHADKKGMRPIKTEDRLQFLVQQNPLVNRLRKELELDVE